MDGNDPNSLMENEPLWVWLVKHQWFDALDEAWQSGLNPNSRDSSGKGWLHHAITEQVPTWVALKGFKLLDQTWWAADDWGRTPLHIPIFDESLAEAMVVRWWSEQLPWSRLGSPFDPMASELPQAARWKEWKSQLRP